MEKKQILKWGILYGAVFFVAFYRDIQSGVLEEGMVIYREASGGESKKVELLLDAENVLENYKVNLEILPQRVTEQEAEAYFLKAMEEIDHAIQVVEKEIPVQTSYVDGCVKAEWNFLPEGIVSMDGTLQRDKIPKEGMLLTVSVTLECEDYEKVYRFPMQVENPQMSVQEEVELELSEWIETQMVNTGGEVVQLPNVLGGVSVTWKEQKGNFAYKIAALEVISLFILYFARKKEEEECRRKVQQQRELLYPAIVNQLLLLMESGMTIRQAWRRIADQYLEKKKYHHIEAVDVYEAIVQMDRHLAEGENERTAYENFANQMDTMSYRRLMRLFLHNLEKGNRDICQQLSLEAKQAYDQRVLLAKKLGEEASTKMLVPMMLMMLLVMLIVIAPAILSFSI